MEEIILYIYKKYGILLSEYEADDFVDWFESNSMILNTEKKLDSETKKYLYEKYKGRSFVMKEEDLSSMNYLLALLRKELNKTVEI